MTVPYTSRIVHLACMRLLLSPLTALAVLLACYATIVVSSASQLPTFAAATFPRHGPTPPPPLRSAAAAAAVKAWRVDGLKCAACVEQVHAVLTAELDDPDVVVELDPPAVYLSRQWTEADLNGALASTPYSVVDMSSPLPPSPPEKHASSGVTAVSLKAYAPLLGVCALVAAGAGVGQAVSGLDAFSPALAMRHSMGLLYLALAGFKLRDVGAFAAAFARYDLLAAAWTPYAFVYPFLELALGALYLSCHSSWLTSALPKALVALPAGLGLVTPARLLWRVTNAFAALLAGVTALGVARALARRRSGPGQQPALVCACLGGGAVQLPMTTVALVENVVMLVMAVAGLLTPTPL